MCLCVWYVEEGEKCTTLDIGHWSNNAESRVTSFLGQAVLT